jgi:hypothetical protein
MGLLRLLTGDDNCIFDNTLNTDLAIEPNSKIAFQKVSMIKKPDCVQGISNARPL